MKLSIAMMLVLGFAATLCAQRAPVYDEKADAKTDIAKAVAAGKSDHKRIILVFGGNW